LKHLLKCSGRSIFRQILFGWLELGDLRRNAEIHQEWINMGCEHGENMINMGNKSWNQRWNFPSHGIFHHGIPPGWWHFEISSSFVSHEKTPNRKAMFILVVVELAIVFSKP